jgi:hypothetical protein
VIVFVDESGFSQRPCRVATWVPKGQTPVIQYHFNWDHLSVIAVQSETARLTSPKLSADARGRFEAIAATARDALTETRRLLGVLREVAPGTSYIERIGAAQIESCFFPRSKATVTFFSSMRTTVPAEAGRLEAGANVTTCPGSYRRQSRFC